MKKSSRRKFLQTSLISGAFGGFAAFARAGSLPPLTQTPPEVPGPFYPVLPQKDKDFDLTRIEGQSSVAKGQVIWIEAEVLDLTGKPIEGVSVELWQANAAGRYRHPHDTNPAPLDPHFQGWAIVASGKEGQIRFKTIMPGAYPASKTWTRPPHIHFKISKRSYMELITQMYFPGHRLNETDHLLKRKRVEEQKLMMASRVKEDPETYCYRIVMQRA